MRDRTSPQIGSGKIHRARREFEYCSARTFRSTAFRPRFAGRIRIATKAKAGRSRAIAFGNDRLCALRRSRGASPSRRCREAEPGMTGRVSAGAREGRSWNEIDLSAHARDRSSPARSPCRAEGAGWPPVGEGRPSRVAVWLEARGTPNPRRGRALPARGRARPDHCRRVPAPRQRVGSRAVEAHRQVERALRGGQPVRLLVGAGIGVLHVEVREPSGSSKGIQLLTAKRSSGLATWKPCVS